MGKSRYNALPASALTAWSLDVSAKTMPFGGRNANRSKGSTLSFSKKKTYTVQDAPPSQKDERGLFGFKSANSLFHGSSARTRRNSVPSGILKRSGQRPVSYPALEDGMVPQEMAAAVPMPRETELNEMFADMVVWKHNKLASP